MTQNSELSKSNTSICIFESMKSTDKFDSIWEWFKKNNFNLTDPIILFDDSFKSRGISYAKQMNRAFLIINTIEDNILHKLNAETLTFLGEREHFIFKMFRRINSFGIPVSIITANDLTSLDRYLSRSSQNSNISIHEPFIKNFITQSEKITSYGEILLRLKNSSALFICAHGDVLCVQLGIYLLCANNPNRTRVKYEKLPTCAKSSNCFRINQLKNIRLKIAETNLVEQENSWEKQKQMGQKNVLNIQDNDLPDRSETHGYSLIHLDELQNKVLFLNTCAGFSITDTKYGDYQDLFPLSSTENSTIIYISSYLIKHSCIEELFLFWALIKKYKNFSVAIYVFNEIIYSSLGEEKLMMMLGDGYICIEDSFSTDYESKVIVSRDEMIILQVDNISTSAVFLSLVTKEHNLLVQNNLSDLMIHVNELHDCTVCLYRYKDLTKTNLGIQFHEKFPTRLRVYIQLKQDLLSQVDLLENRVISSMTFHQSFILDQEDRDSIYLQYSKLRRLFMILMRAVSRSDLNGKKYMRINVFLKILILQLSSLEDQLIVAITTNSMKIGTYRILNEENLQIEEELHTTGDKCYICGNDLVEMRFRDLNNRALVFLQSICPECGIVSVRSGLSMMHIFSPDTVQRNDTVMLQISFPDNQNESQIGKLGVVLLSGNVSSNVVDMVLGTQCRHTILMTIPNELHPGLYYWRCALICNGSITISHRPIFVT